MFTGTVSTDDVSRLLCTDTDDSHFGLPHVGRCNAEPISQVVLCFCGFVLQPWLGLWDPVVFGEDLVMAARVVPPAVPPGSCWSD